MVKFWSLAAMAAFALAATTSVEAQNAAVHAPDLESRAATPAVASATAPKARASTSTSAAAAGTTSKATAQAGATTSKAATTPKAGTTATAAGTTAKTNATAAASKAPLSSSAAPATNSATWVENKIKANPTQKACYRRVSLASNKQCAKGYAFDNLVSCWSQCPLDYPVQCGFECLPQNKDCALEVATKASAIATTALSVATSGVFGALLKAATGAQKALACGQAILDVTTKISGEVDKLAEGKALTDKEKAKTAISNMDFALYDIPAAIATCLGTTLPANYQSTKKFTKYVEKLIVSAIDMKFENINPIDPKNFVNFYKSFRDFWVKDTTAAADGKLTEVTADDFVKIGQTATTCGGMLKDYIDKVQNTVADYIKKNPTSTADKLDFAVLNLPLILQDLPKATVNCIKSNSADGIKTRDEIITAARLISEQVINLAKSGAKNALKTLDQYKLEIAQFGLDVIAFWDPLQISALVKEFLMPICPLTEYKGVIQRGTADQALGLEMVGKAFEKTYGTWENEGDGQIYFRFESFDTKDVKINVMSGGKKVYEWALGAKKKLKMTGPLTLFAGKTLYIDRWRPGILNFMGTGGGSLLMWVPENTKGSITLEIAVNPTEIGDR